MNIRNVFFLYVNAVFPIVEKEKELGLFFHLFPVVYKTEKS